MRGRARLAVLAALILGALLAGCGSGGDITGTIPKGNASQLKSDLDDVETAIESRDCELAHQKVDDFLTSVDQLPEESGTELKDALREVGDHLDNLIDPECNPTPTTTGASGETGVVSSTTTTTTPPPETTSTSTTSSTTETTTSTTTQAEEEESPSPSSEGGGPPPTSNAGGNSGGTGGSSGGVGGGSG